MILAPRAVAAKKFGIARWALTLAPSVVARARRIRPLGRHGLDPGGPPALGAATAVPPALGLTVHAALGGAAVLPAAPEPDGEEIVRLALQNQVAPTAPQGRLAVLGGG